jgi:hypothetical protein
MAPTSFLERTRSTAGRGPHVPVLLEWEKYFGVDPFGLETAQQKQQPPRLVEGLPRSVLSPRTVWVSLWDLLTLTQNLLTTPVDISGFEMVFYYLMTFVSFLIPLYNALRVAFV